MSYKTILVHAGPDANAAALVGAARSVGARFDATIVGVGALAWDPYADPGLGFADAEAVVALHNDLDSDIQAAEQIGVGAAIFQGGDLTEALAPLLDRATGGVE